MPSPAFEDLARMSLGYEYYADAYVGDDAPFRDRQPSPDELCKIIQEMCLAAQKVLAEYQALENKLP